MHFAPIVALAFAAVATAAPAATVPAQTGDDVVCGAVVSPFTHFLDFQSGNVAVSSQGILKGIDGLISESKADSSVQQVVQSATDGLAESLINGVSAVLYGLSAGVRAASPECKGNMAYCNSELEAARDSTSSNQPEAKDACLQAKYACGDFYTSQQVNQMIPGCSQYS